MTGNRLALKDEVIDPNIDRLPILPYEATVYRLLGGHQGIPRVYWHGSDERSHVLVLEKLGADLGHLRRICRGRFSLKTTLMLAEQMVRARRRGVASATADPLLPTSSSLASSSRTLVGWSCETSSRRTSRWGWEAGPTSSTCSTWDWPNCSRTRARASTSRCARTEFRSAPARPCTRAQTCSSGEVGCLVVPPTSRLHSRRTDRPKQTRRRRRPRAHVAVPPSRPPSLARHLRVLDGGQADADG